MKNLTHSRTLAARLFASALLLATSCSALADVHYVDVNSANSTPPYLSWATAATNIQDAVDTAVAGDEIVVTNGIYATGGHVVGRVANRVAVDKPLHVRSVNGPQFTTIAGGGSRCVYLTNGVSLFGFTLTNGLAGGGGISDPSGGGGGAYGGTLSNCTLTGNGAEGVGGGACNSTLNNCTLTGNRTGVFGGGAALCTLNNCSLTGNSAYYGGGTYGGTLNNCTLIGNRTYFGALYYDAYGGGAAYCTLNDCTLTGNSVTASWRAVGGGAVSCTLNNCTLTSNSADNRFLDSSGDAQGSGAAGCTLNNCTLTGNSAIGRGFGGGAYGSRLNNCTLTGNSAHYRGDGAHISALNNCIDLDGSATSTLNHCWITDPLFVDQTSGNLRLQSNSPCINAGLNAFAPAGPDLDGNPRIAGGMGGTVDIGAYEFQNPASTISYAWLQQFNLPISPSTDTADPDGDRLSNWQEGRCRTDPTNALSALRVLAPSAAGADVMVTWQSIAGVNYSLERATNLAESPAFTPLATNLPGQPGTTAYMDTNAFGNGPFFYRVGVGD